FLDPPEIAVRLDSSENPLHFPEGFVRSGEQDPIRLDRTPLAHGSLLTAHDGKASGAGGKRAGPEPRRRIRRYAPTRRSLPARCLRPARSLRRTTGSGTRNR